MHRRSLILAKRRNPEILDSIGSQDNMGAAPFYPCMFRPVLLSWKCPKTAPCFFHHPQEFVSLVGRLPFYVVKKAALRKFWNSKVFYPWWWWREGEGGKRLSICGNYTPDLGTVTTNLNKLPKCKKKHFFAIFGVPLQKIFKWLPIGQFWS